MRIKDKVAIVTGGGRGIGKSISMTLAREGADVVIFGRTLDVAEQTADEIRALGRKALAIQVNVAESSEVNHGVQKVIDEFGKIDILINNAGMLDSKSFLDIEIEDYDKIFKVNSRAPFILSK